MDVQRINKIMQAVLAGVPMEEVCETDEERLHYELTKDTLEDPATSHQGLTPISDQP